MTFIYIIMSDEAGLYLILTYLCMYIYIIHVSYTYLYVVSNYL